VEYAMGRIVQELSNTSTIVRWSAAKGVGRVTERLPSLCADDVLDAILLLFRDADQDRCWHGACLALAELARRGLLSPQRLPDMMPFLIQAAHYDRRRGFITVGAHVRDAACYTYWAFTRAYDPRILQPFISDMTRAIILTSLFDREVNF
jgi:tubulin-specific chaperone D